MNSTTARIRGVNLPAEHGGLDARDRDVAGGPGVHVPGPDELVGQCARTLDAAFDDEDRSLVWLFGAQLAVESTLVALFRDDGPPRHRGHSWAPTSEVTSQALDRLREPCAGEGRYRTAAPAPVLDPLDLLNGRRLTAAERRRLVARPARPDGPEPLVIEHALPQAPPTERREWRRW